MVSGPHAIKIGKVEERQRLTEVRKLCGHSEIGPSGVIDQSIERISFPISPPPDKNCVVIDSLLTAIVNIKVAGCIVFVVKQMNIYDYF